MAPRGMLVKSLIERRSPWIKKSWIRFAERRTIARSAGVHITTRVEGLELAKLGLDRAPLYLVPNGLDPMPSEVGSLPDALPAHLREHGQDFILFLSRINWKKGLDRLIPAMKWTTGVHLVIAGNDEDGYRKQLDPLVQEHSLKERVHFIGPVEDQDKWSLLRKARLMALPSYSENFGNVVLEAMQAGCPVVVTKEVGLADSVAEVESGLVTSGEPQALGRAFMALLENPDLCEVMGERGQEAVRKRFAWEAVGAQVESIYREILRASGKMG